MAKEGIIITLWTALLFVLFLLANFWYRALPLQIITIGIGIIFLFHFYFFRDPERTPPANDRAIISPADGRVIEIVEEQENRFINGPATRISIFLSVFNVHVNRIPYSGTIAYLDYKHGEFLAAFDNKSSELNEQSIIGIQTGRGKILFKQIAGLIARRIVYYLETGQNVQSGERFGLIKYGSRVDVFLEPGVKILVKPKDKVIGGETILGEWQVD